MATVTRFQAPQDGQLNKVMAQSYQQQGYLVLENFIDATTCDALISQAERLVEQFEPASLRSIFSSKDQAHKADDYFKTSGDKIRFFFEPDAFTDDGVLTQDKALSINKIGHAMHDLDPVFERLSRTTKLAVLAATLGLRRPLLLQSMYIFKQPYIGGEVNCHQDATFLHTEPLSCVGFWFALQDATIENGCLYAIPGQHALKQRFYYQGDELVMDTWDETPWPQQQAVALEAPKGTLIVLHGLLPHLSGANKSPHSRHAYTLHLIDGTCHYRADNWLRRDKSMPLRGFS